MQRSAAQREGRTILQGDDSCDLLQGLGEEVLLGPDRQHALLAGRQLWRWLPQAAGQHHVRARALEQGEDLQPTLQSAYTLTGIAIPLEE